MRIRHASLEQFRSGRLTGMIGETSPLLQLKEYCFSSDKVFSFSADSGCLHQTTLLEFIDKLYKFEGYRIFFVDEVHNYKNWSQELKNIYDSYPDIKVVFPEALFPNY